MNTRSYWVRTESIGAVPHECYLMGQEGDGLQVTVCPDLGAEATSIRLRRNSVEVELLYRANDFSKTDEWQGRAPILWPAVGRNFTDHQVAEALRTGKEPGTGRYRIAGREFEIPCHGFAMSSKWEIKECKALSHRAEILCLLKDNDQTRTWFPFGFLVTAAWGIKGYCLELAVTVEAAKRNQDHLPFSIGNHLSLNFPFLGPCPWEQGLVRGPATLVYGINDISLFDGNVTPRCFEKGITLDDETLYNMVIGGFSGDCWMELVEPGGLTVRVSQHFDEQPGLARARYFVFWAERDKGYFCPEPWLGGPNSLNTGEGLVRVAPGERFTWTMRLDVSSES